MMGGEMAKMTKMTILREPLLGGRCPPNLVVFGVPITLKKSLIVYPPPKWLRTLCVVQIPALKNKPELVIKDLGVRFRQKVLYLERLNVDSSKAMTKNPEIRTASLETLESVERCLSSIGIDRSDMGRIFGMHPQLLTCSPELHLHPVFKFLLNDVQIPYLDLRKSITRCPRLLVSSVTRQLRPTLYFLRRLGFVGPHAITCQTTLLLVSSVETTLIPKLDYLQSLGFTRRDAVKMVLRSPSLFTLSIDKNFRPKVHYFLNEMKGDLNELKDFPQFFSFSLEGRIKRRHRLLLDHGFSLPLPDMLRVSDGEFSDRLVEMRLHTLDKKSLT